MRCEPNRAKLANEHARRRPASLFDDSHAEDVAADHGDRSKPMTRFPKRSESVRPESPGRVERLKGSAEGFSERSHRRVARPSRVEPPNEPIAPSVEINAKSAHGRPLQKRRTNPFPRLVRPTEKAAGRAIPGVDSGTHECHFLLNIRHLRDQHELRGNSSRKVVNDYW